MLRSPISRVLSVLVGGGLAGLGLVVAPAANADPAPLCAGTPSVCTVTFTATGGDQSFTVPGGVPQLTVTANGAQGSGDYGGGLGGQSMSTLTVTPGQVLEVVVGNQSGFNGGGAAGVGNLLGFGSDAGGSGGGASDVRSGTCAATLTCASYDREVVGAGGGGAGGTGRQGSPRGGAGGGTVGSAGAVGPGCGSAYPASSGGTQFRGGAGGNGSTSGGGGGRSGVGGGGGYGGGPGGGGGGGGFQGGGGGGGGNSDCDGGGAGGSSFGPDGATLTSGVQSGDGVVTISYDNPIQTQTIDFPQPTTPAAYGTSDTLTATAMPSNLTVTYTVDGSGTPVACTISGSTVTYTGIGSCVIDANQAGNASFSAAPQVQWPVTVTKAATTTTLTVNPPSPALNQATTLTATVHHTGTGVAPTGSVSFYDGTTLLGTATVQPDATATLVTSFGGGAHSITAVYDGDTHYLGSTSSPAATFTTACTQTITGTHSALTVTSGTTCLRNATITGGISVARGATLDIENSTVQGSISANHPAGLRICGSTTSAISVSGATGYVRIGDPTSNCTPNTINGGLTAAKNTGGGTISGNTITGSWTITNNTPPFTVSGNHH